LNIGLKESSFYDNAKQFGMPTNVAGGLSTQTLYYVKIIEGNEEKYIKREPTGELVLVENVVESTKYFWSNELVRFVEKLKNKYLRKVILVPVSQYWNRGDYKK
jgi:hypothetical protein